MSSTIITTHQNGGLNLSSAETITITSTGALTGAVPDTTSPPSTFHSAIFADSSAPVYLLNAGTITAPGNAGFSNGVDLRDGGTIVNAQTGLISGAEQGYGIIIALETAPIVISNAGTITSVNHAVALEDVGNVDLTNSVTGVITASSAGLFVQGGKAVSIVNDGHITSTTDRGAVIGVLTNAYIYNGASGAIKGVTGGLGLYANSPAAETIVNAGSITGGSSGYGIEVGLEGAANITNDGSGVIAGGGNGLYAVSGVQGSSLTLSNAGTIMGSNGILIGDKYAPVTSNISNLGTIIGNGGTAIDDNNGVLHLSVGVAAKFVGNVIATANISQYDPATSSYSYTAAQNVLELLSGSSTGTLSGIGTSFQNFSTIVIDKNAAWSLSGDAPALTGGNEIEGFTKLDTLELTGFAATRKSFANNELTLTGSGTEVINIVAAGASTADFTVTTDGTNSFITTDIACFYPGTRIATPAGERLVEELAAGDEILTVNGPRQLRWVGQNHVSTRFSSALRVLPVRIQAGALGGGLPRRDLLLSADHALFFSGTLVQAGALVGFPGITREQNVPERFTYYHLELATHELLYAEGVEAESFVDNITPRLFQNWESRKAPELSIAEMPYPRVKSARQLPAWLRAALSGKVQAQSA